jgi:hypothetical protein
VVLGLSRRSREETCSSIATILKEWNSIALAKDRKWNLRKVRDVIIAPQQLM